MRMFALVLAGTLTLAASAFAQDGKQSLADIKAELTTLSGQIEQLRNELVRTGASGGLPTQAASALTRVDQLEAELRRLTDSVDVLTNDVIRITGDASNRVGDIEFRLTELEGGDTSVKPEPAPLGGGISRPKPRPLGPRMHTVRTGETFASIARKTRHSMTRLQQLNPKLKATALQPGDRVRLRK